MGKQVRIKVTGTQIGSSEPIITETFGNMIYKEPYYYVSYEEQLDEESGQKSRTTLRFNEKSLRVSRKGEVTSTLEFEENEQHSSLYITAFGNFEVDMITDVLQIKCSEKDAAIFADYRIGLNKTPPSKGRLEVIISPD